MWLKRTRTCGELRSSDEGSEVVLNGWVDARRDHGGLIFVDLRDRYGITQVVFRSEGGGAHKLAEDLRSEFVIGVRGKVQKRSPETVNPKMATGEIEVEASELQILNEAKTPPFEILDTLSVGEETRLKYRYLDLRRPSMQRNFIVRDNIVQAIRESMHGQGFIDIETPSMVKPTPGGARNFVVPSRLFAGEFFALAESPQIFKQLFMVAGLDKYYQIARCWRDEDLRADRQPEFTQLDVEMSFVEQDDVMTPIEKCMKHMWKQVVGADIEIPFRRISYDEAMLKYGSDKPDLRFGLEIVDVTEILRDCEFKVFSKTIASGGVVRGLNAQGCGSWPRSEIDGLVTYISGIGGKGLAWTKVEEGKFAGGSAKFFSDAERNAVIDKMGAKAGDLLLWVADEEESAASYLGGLRNHLRDKLGLVKDRKDEYNFCWVVNFPMFEYSEDDKAWVARHHPFTSPRDEDLDKLESDPGRVKAKAYDLVLNGVEIGGGSIRIHRRDVQWRVFKALGFSEDYIRDRFSFLLGAFEYGAPPHGGIALGVDRLAMLILGLENIRDVISFPKTQRSTCLMTGAPTTITEKQLKELFLKIAEPPAKK